jgi:hypothetical protein
MKKLSILFLVICMSIPAFSQLDNQLYIRFGLSKPTSSFLYDNSAIWDAYDAKLSGAVLEFGSIFMLNSIPLGSNMAIGINADWVELTTHSIKSDDYDINSRMFGVSSKIGPSFSISPVGDLTIDASIKFKMNWVSAAFMDWEDIEEANSYAGSRGMGFATGVNVRYKFLMVGVEYNKVKTKLGNAADNDVYLMNYEDSDVDKSPIGHWNIMFGFSF